MLGLLATFVEHARSWSTSPTCKECEYGQDCNMGKTAKTRGKKSPSDLDWMPRNFRHLSHAAKSKSKARHRTVPRSGASYKIQVTVWQQTDSSCFLGAVRLIW